ncbi:hypothetical protein [Spiroplasma kunkelii]|nr:hypothetical protein [Spiroplasma kunkelii]
MKVNMNPYNRLTGDVYIDHILIIVILLIKNTMLKKYIMVLILKRLYYR